MSIMEKSDIFIGFISFVLISCLVDAVEPSQTPLILELPETDQLSNISIQAPLHGNNDVQPIDYLNRYEKLDLNQCKREEIGRKTKRILDAARAHFVKENMGLKCVELKYYTTKDISLENVVIICNNYITTLNDQL